MMFGFLGDAIGGIANKLFDRGSDAVADKVVGVPTPVSRDGSEQGRDYRGFMNEAFPGTTPWERLGANSPMGAISSSEIAAKSAQQMQSRELSNRSSIADSTNRAHIISSTAPLGPSGQRSSLDQYNRGSGSDYDTKVRQDREALPSHISKQVSEGALAGAKLPQQRAFSDVARSAGDFVKRGFHAVDRFSKFAHDYSPAQQGVNAAYALKERFISNSGRRPRRFDA